MRRKAAGIFYGAMGAVCYGTNPLFALNLYHHGFNADSVLFYRYCTAAIIFGLWTFFVKKIPLQLKKEEFLPLFVMGLLFSFSSLTLFTSYSYIDAGIASVILFVYPIFVAIIMALGFKEHLPKSTILSIVLVTLGIFLFYKGKEGQSLDLYGLMLVFLSALFYAIYMVGIKTNQILKHMNSSKLTFYVMIFGLSVYIWNLKFCTQLQPIQQPVLWINVLMLALLPTIVSLETMTISIKFIGPTLSAIISALEPVSAMFFCVVFFHEELTGKIVSGMIAILLAVYIIIMGSKKPVKS